MSSANRLIKGLTWLVTGRFAGALLSIASTAVLARLLAPSDFGSIAAALAILAVSNVLFDGAFGLNLIRQKTLSPIDVRTTLTLAIVLALAISFIVVVASPLVEAFFDFPQLAAILMVSALSIPLKAITSVGTALLQRNGRFKAIALSSVVSQFAGYFLVAAPMAMADAGAWALVAALVVAGAVEATLASLWSKLSFVPCLEPQARNELLHSSLFSVSHLLNWVANTSANVVVGRTMGAVQLGFYSRGWKLLDVVVASTATPLSRVLIPSFARLKEYPERVRSAFERSLQVSISLFAVVSAFLTMHAPVIVLVALGSQWESTTPVAQILFATIVPRCTFKISESLAMALGRPSATVMRQALYATLMLAGSIIASQFGIVAVAVAVSVAITTFYLSSVLYAAKLAGTGLLTLANLHFRPAVLAGGLACLDGVLLWVFRSQPLFIAHPISGAISGIVLLTVIAVAPSFWLGADVSDKIKSFIRRWSSR